jgi:hypothetical protein
MVADISVELSRRNMRGPGLPLPQALSAGRADGGAGIKLSPPVPVEPLEPPEGEPIVEPEPFTEPLPPPDPDVGLPPVADPETEPDP